LEISRLHKTIAWQKKLAKSHSRQST